MTSQELKKIIEDEAKRRGIAEATLCRLAVGNNRLHRTLKNGGSCTLDIANRLKEFVAASKKEDAAT